MKRTLLKKALNCTIPCDWDGPFKGISFVPLVFYPRKVPVVPLKYYS